MASVSHYEMRRYPIGPLDPPPLSGLSAYYVSANQKITVTPEKCTKKTWGQRLKITKNNEKLTNESSDLDYQLHQVSSGQNPGQSSLSKSMKYAESWLYGTVRGIPAPSVHGPGLFGSYPHEVAVMVCSCPEFLNGTKRELKKASICKKCKGSRLPLAPIGGTVRIHSSPGQQIITRQSAGTLRLPSTSALSKKSRPSILDSKNDPYDLMRRSRLVSPELKPVKNNAKSRAKSISPKRGRSKNRKRSPSPYDNRPVASNRSRSVTRVKIQSPGGGQECWMDSGIDIDPSGRRSILHYDVNPYDLISKTKNSSSEFSPVNDDNFNYDLILHSRKYENILNPAVLNNNAAATTTASTTTSISGQRIRTSKQTSKSVSYRSNKKNAADDDDETSIVYEHINVNLLGKLDQIQRDQQQQQQPEPEDNLVLTRETLSKISTELTPTSSSIKSILKRPTSLVFTPASDDPDILSHCETTTTTTTTNISQSTHTIVNHRDTTSYTTSAAVDPMPSAVLASITNFDKNTIHSIRNQSKLNVDCRMAAEHEHRGTSKNRNNSNTTPTSSNSTSSSSGHGSHFYLPMPPRKKVQFLVENNIIHDEMRVLASSHHHVDVDHHDDVVVVQQESAAATQAASTHNDKLNNEMRIRIRADANENHNAEKCLNNEVTATSMLLGKQRNDVLSNAANGAATSIITTSATVGADENEGDNGDDEDEARSSHDRDDICKGSSTQIFPRFNVMRRSFSERGNKLEAKNGISFLDTMALRIKNNKYRRDSRTIFHHDQNQQKPAKVLPSPDYSENEKSSSDSSSYYDDENIYEDYSPTVNVIVNNLKNEIQSKTTNEFKKILAHREVLQGSRIFGGPTSPNATVVAISSPSSNNESASGVHRLEVKHLDHDDYDTPAKKTSIMISGDDCYSTVNVSDNTQIYQSSVVVNDDSGAADLSHGVIQSSSNTVTISVNSPPQTPEDEVVYRQKRINRGDTNSVKSVIPIGSESIVSQNRGSTVITLDFQNTTDSEEQSIKELLRNPVEAVRLNLVPHVCGKTTDDFAPETIAKVAASRALAGEEIASPTKSETYNSSFITKLLEDSNLVHLADGLDNELVAKLIENSLIRLKENRDKPNGTKDDEDLAKLIDISLEKVKEEREKLTEEEPTPTKLALAPVVEEEAADKEKDKDTESNRDSVSSGNSYSSANYELFDFENTGELSDCYQSCSSELTADDDGNLTRSKFYQMLVDATLSEIEVSVHTDDDHLYESIRLNGGDPIYEEISEIPPPLPLCPPPDLDLDKKNRSIFEGASKYDILSYLVDAKERGLVPEESYAYNFSNSSDIIIEEAEPQQRKDVPKVKKLPSSASSRISQLSSVSDSSVEETLMNDKVSAHRKSSTEIERNDSGVGSETSKTSRSRFLISPNNGFSEHGCPIHLCEDCDSTVETQMVDSGVMFAPLVCRKCSKKRAERKEIITEIVETEEKYGRDLQIILEEFYQPMLVAGLLTQEQLSAIFLNAEELLENNQALSERMRDTLEIAVEQGDDDLLTMNIGRLVLDAAPMLHAFESYCVRQASSSILLANLEKEKELLRIFLRVSQMENTVLRRMNLNSFLMVPVQRVTKYPLLLARLYKVTPAHLEGRELLKQAQEKIELHLNHMNREAKDVPLKLWRRISSSSPGRRSSCEMDMINIKLRKMAVDILEWNHDEVRFAVEGRLLYTQPTDNNWRKGRTIKLTHVNALLVTNGKPSANYKADRINNEPLNFPKHTGIRESSLLLVREKGGRYTLLREPLFLDRCIVCTEADWDDYFEVQEISSKDTFIFKAEDSARTKHWYTQLQYHAQGMGAWRKRRNALANIMINGMMMRN